METLYLKRGEERRLRAGHLWVFSNEVDVARSPLNAFMPGQAVNVADAASRILGTAYVNPSSLIAARLVSRRPDTPLDADLARSRLADALALRQSLFHEPFYRLCHGEGDWLPGLVVDRHGDHLVAQISTASMDRLTPILTDILSDMLKPASLLLDNDISSRDFEALPRTVTNALGSAPDSVEVRENGLTYRAPLREGQKTGWFYDQRDNRMALIPFAPGAAVLDAFCYAGGFGALALRHGARAVTFADASSTALDFARQNAERAAPQSSIECLHGDALNTLARLRREGRRFDLVCLDPPAFIKRRKDARQGLEAYRRINELGLDLVKPGGVLMTCSCSHHLDAETLRALAAKAAAKRRMPLRLLRQGFQGADHPIHPSMPETAYLKTLLFQVPA
ncbi:MAG: class I SAM-dependent rRNA methyltransferase [Desulfovibrionaceae bacterium]|nr:class I SAM-dependent rRNA methyltransferase [Desulfovibrionaceae bacterium]